MIVLCIVLVMLGLLTYSTTMKNHWFAAHHIFELLLIIIVFSRHFFQLAHAANTSILIPFEIELVWYYKQYR